VRGDGLFHVEQETSNRVDIAEGILDEAELAALKTVLSNQELAAVDQQKIPVPLMISERDALQISIPRSPSTQNIKFVDRESRRPFDKFIEPAASLDGSSAKASPLAVSRDGHVQQLSFASYFGVPGFVSNINSGTDAEERIVRPLRKWLKTHIEARKLDALPDASVTHCVALPEVKQP
jgi:hypothetical protein